MSVELEPTDLGFRRPFTTEVTQILKLKNENNGPVAFKVKTTAPKQYCVRPNSGFIDSGKEVEIQVLLQAMKEDPPLDARCRDKFLVQSGPVNPDQVTSSVASIWEHIPKESIKERKIRVTFLSAHDSSHSPRHSSINGTHNPDEAPPAYRSPSPPFGSPAHSTAGTTREAETPTKDGVVAGAVNSAASAIPGAASATGQTLQQQLDAAKETIANLRTQNDDQVLRQRKTDAVAQDSRERITTGTTGMGVQTQPAEGVPVQIVAALCLLSFLLAYFFF